MKSLRRSQPAESGTSTAWRQERLRFTGFSYDRTATGQVTCRVTMELGAGEIIEGEACGQASPSGDTRLGAEAALRAIETFTRGALSFELVGVKVVRAFDSKVVITNIVQRGVQPGDRLLGCYLTDEDEVRGAAISVMNATNRALGTYILTQ